MNSKSFITFLIASVVLSSAACKKNIGMESYQGRSLSFDLAMADTGRDLTDTDAGTKAFELKSADGSITLPLEYSVTDGIGEAPQAGEAQTKGTQYNYLSQLEEDPGTFNVTAWSSNGDRFIPEAGVEAAYSTVNYHPTSGRWTIDAGTAPMWKNADEKTFFAYANLPDGASVTCGSKASHTFTYTILETAADQKDALLGYYQGIGDRDGDGVSDGVAKVQFIHPLTAVVFMQGEFQGISAIESLSIEGVYGGGTTEVSYEYSDNKLVPRFDWGTSRSATTTVTVTQTVPNSGALPALGGQIGESFILIPQNLSEKKVTIKAVVALTAGGEQTVQAELNTGNWEAGKTNTYTLGYDASAKFNLTQLPYYNAGTL